MIYRAIAVHDPPWWSIEITHGLPAHMLGVSQARRLSDVETVAREVIADLTEVDQSEVEVEVSVVRDRVAHQSTIAASDRRSPPASS